MAKKKKTQLKPVARGFATTSMPSKKDIVAAQEKEIEESTPAETVDNGEGPSDSSNPVQDTAADLGRLKEEELVLQALVDKWQEKTEREIGRTLKAVETEHRMARSYTLLSLEPTWRDRVLELLQSDQEGPVPLSSDDPEDKLLPRLGQLYGMLRRMGVPEERVKKCLDANQRIDLEEALEWLTLHSGKDELPWKKESGEVDRTMPRTPQAGYSFQSLPQTPLLPLTSISSPKTNMSETGTNSPVVPLEAEVEMEPVASDPAATNGLRLLSLGPTTTEESPQFSDSGDEVDLSNETDPNILYARLRLELLRLQRKGQSSRYQSRISAIEKRIKEAQDDYMFSNRLAQAEFAVKKAELEANALQVRLKKGSGPGQLPLIQASTTKKAKGKPTALPIHVSSPPSTTGSPKSVFNEVEEDTMFGNLLDEPLKEEITPAGVVITVKDMPLPKVASNKLPSNLLVEAVNKYDRYATIQYKVVSGASRAVRCSCTIRWTGGRADQWMMDTVACRESNQAEQYVATLALHDTTFPLSLGFAGGVVANGYAVNYRVLSIAFRDLWDELEASRKQENDSINRSIWSHLRDILQQKSAKKEVSQKAIKDSSIPQHSAHQIPSSSSSGMLPEQIIGSLYARQSTIAYQTMLYQRQSLPIAAYRQQIVQTLEDHQVLVLSGETGCGKSTQLPAFIMEDQIARGRACKVICTEPRRISAISLAQRVSAEMGEPPGAVGTNSSLIGYSIRLESNIAKSTRLAFVTNGIALRMLEGGSGQGGGAAIDEVTHLIVDEVHERSIESDFLLIILKSLLQQRPDLKVVLMSATLDAEKVATFFGDCPTIHVPGRTFPVDVKFLEDAVEFSGWQIDESSPYAKRKNDKYSRNKNVQPEWNEDNADPPEDDDGFVPEGPVLLEKRYSTPTVTTVNLLDERIIPYDLILRMLERLCFEDEAYGPYSAAVLVFLPGINEIRRLHDILSSHAIFSTDAFRIYPLHSSVSSEGQGAVFEVPPPGVRKIVISTNISETGITIPDITAVIDSGKHRQMMFDEKRQLSRLVEMFIAKSNAAQRRGRAGRVQNGLCFHLFTKLRHDTIMAEHPVPEMLRLSLSDLALRTKIMKVDVGSSIEDILSKALDPPSAVNVQRAVASLVEVGALTVGEEITPLGRYLAQLPTDVHLGKFLLTATMFKCLDPALTIAAALNSKSPFLTPFGKEDEAERQKAAFRLDNSDFLTIHNAFATWRRACGNGQNAARTLCRKSYLSWQNLQQIEEIRQQYLGYLIDSSLIQVDRSYEKELSRARYNQNRNKPRFIMVPPELDVNYSPGKSAMINAAIVAGLYPKILMVENQQMVTLGNNQPAYFHPSSVNFRHKPLEVSVGGSCLVYFTLMHSRKLYVWETGPVDNLALVLLCGDVEFKISAESVVVDRKIKFRADAQTVVVLKHLRSRLQKMIQNKLGGRKSISLDLSNAWGSLAMAVLGKLTEPPASV